MARESKCRGCREWKRELEKAKAENRKLVYELKASNEDRRSSMRVAEQAVCDLTIKLQRFRGGVE